MIGNIHSRDLIARIPISNSIGDTPFFEQIDPRVFDRECSKRDVKVSYHLIDTFSPGTFDVYMKPSGDSVYLDSAENPLPNWVFLGNGRKPYIKDTIYNIPILSDTNSDGNLDTIDQFVHRVPYRISSKEYVWQPGDQVPKQAFKFGTIPQPDFVGIKKDKRYPEASKEDNLVQFLNQTAYSNFSNVFHYSLNPTYKVFWDGNKLDSVINDKVIVKTPKGDFWNKYNHKDTVYPAGLRIRLINGKPVDTVDVFEKTRILFEKKKPGSLSFFEVVDMNNNLVFSKEKEEFGSDIFSRPDLLGSTPLPWIIDDYPNMPYASDDLKYFWNFDDPNGLPCTTRTEIGSKYTGLGLDSTKCNFSTATLPWHRFETGYNYDVSLRVRNPKYENVSWGSPRYSFDTVSIIMSEPDVNWDDENFIGDSVLSINYSGSDSIFLCDLNGSRSNPEGVERVLSASVWVNNQKIDSTRYLISSFGSAYLVFNQKPSFGSQLKIHFKTQRVILDGREKVGHKYDLRHLDYEDQIGLGSVLSVYYNYYDSAFSPRRGFILEGKPCTYDPQTMNLKETLPLFDNRDNSYRESRDIYDFGIVPDSATYIDTFCIDTSFDLFGGIENIDTNFSFHWLKPKSSDFHFSFIPYNFNTDLHRLFYREPGCKTVGVWIQSRPKGKIDTFWFTDYKYITDLKTGFKVISSDIVKPTPYTYYAPLRENYGKVEINVSPWSKDQQNVVSSEFILSKVDFRDYSYRYDVDSLKKGGIKYPFG